MKTNMIFNLFTPTGLLFGCGKLNVTTACSENRNNNLSPIK